MNLKIKQNQKSSWHEESVKSVTVPALAQEAPNSSEITDCQKSRKCDCEESLVIVVFLQSGLRICFHPLSEAES